MFSVNKLVVLLVVFGLQNANCFFREGDLSIQGGASFGLSVANTLPNGVVRDSSTAVTYTLGNGTTSSANSNTRSTTLDCLVETLAETQAGPCGTAAALAQVLVFEPEGGKTRETAINEVFIRTWCSQLAIAYAEGVCIPPQNNP
eukprot:TRINITY_DN12357_c0_g1_i3.p3 TRINITY_DN12357_c0_g1~~TRINITY_DN12357_c0_g1_i3.p3  ORF type:complete len:145 (-),score=14.58 TRINITY_DN12357_c0_g1_i3:290-724(-)